MDPKGINAIRHLNDCNGAKLKPANVDLVVLIGGHIGVLGFYPIFKEKYQSC